MLVLNFRCKVYLQKSGDLFIWVADMKYMMKYYTVIVALASFFEIASLTNTRAH